MRLWRSARECTHVVVPGDNLYRIAIRYDTTVEVFKRHNNLASHILTIGQRLLLPSYSPEACSFAPGTEVCFEYQGELAFVDTAKPERPVHTIAAYANQGMTCGKVNHPGIVVLIARQSGG